MDAKGDEHRIALTLSPNTPGHTPGAFHVHPLTIYQGTPSKCLADPFACDYFYLMPLFTRETAASAGRKGALARWTKPPPVVIPPPITEPITDDYHARRIMRVRQQLDRIDAMLMEEEDAQKIDRLASAQLRLSEQERVMSGRPLPGSRKPLPERRSGSEDRPLSPKPACGPDTTTGCVNPQVQANETPQGNSSQ